jgi:hypothetical protein
LGRLTAYFDNIDLRLREGQGCLIFNADRNRANRIGRFIGDRLREYRPLVSSYLVPWRDFALNAYMLKVELAPTQSAPAVEVADARQVQEYALAGRVTQDMYYHMCYCDLFVLNGVDPSYRHEVGYLDQIIGARLQNRRASILISPHMPHELEADFAALDPAANGSTWKRFFAQLYDTCLIAL